MKSKSSPGKPDLISNQMSVRLAYGFKLRPSAAKVCSVCIQKLSSCFRRAELATICSITITVRSSKVNKPVAEHFNTIDHTFEDLTVMVIEQVVANSAQRKQRESFWIHTLETLAPDGISLDP